PTIPTIQNMAPSSISGAIEDKKQVYGVVSLARPATSSSVSVTNRKVALEAVYDSYVEQIYKFIFFKVGNREDAEDITSQVFIKAANSLDVTQSAQTQTAWLYQVARTTITDHWRGYYRGVTFSLDEMEESAPLSLPAEPVFAGAVEND